MTEQEQVKKQLEGQLEEVDHRLQILDMIEEKIFRMKELAQRVIDEDLTDKEIMKINNQVQNLGEQIKLLDSEATKLS